MTDINTVCLIGNLTRDAHISDVGQTKKADVSLAVNRSMKKGDAWVDEPSYIDVVIWGPSEHQQKNLVKGAKLAINGYIKQERWEKDGEKKSKVVVVATQTQLLKTSSNEPSSAPVEAGESFQNDIPF